MSVATCYGQLPGLRLALGLVAMIVSCTLSLGCASGPRSIEESRLEYNEAIKSSAAQELLLNIVRLRYMDTPCNLSSPNVAHQKETGSSLTAPTATPSQLFAF